MRGLAGLMSSILILTAASLVAAQPPGPGQEVYSQSATGGDLVTRMMEFDKDKDGKLTKNEVADKRLHRLFARSDANNDGTVTKEELASLAAKEESKSGGRSFGFGPPGGRPGGGPGGFMMMPPRPGEILSPMVQQRLRLSALQKAELASIQKEVDERLEKILNDEQKKQIQEMRQRGPGGFGPRGGGPPGFGPGDGGPLGDGPRGGFGPPGPR
jgi:EF hand